MSPNGRIEDVLGVVSEDFFKIYYKTKKDLMKVFVAKLKASGSDDRLAKQHRNQVEMIWGTLDKKFVMFPKNPLSNKYALQDNYHRPLFCEIGKGGVEGSTLRARYTSFNFFLTFLRKRGIFAGLTGSDITNVLENIQDLNKELGPKISQRRIDVRKIERRI